MVYFICSVTLTEKHVFRALMNSGILLSSSHLYLLFMSQTILDDDDDDDEPSVSWMLIRCASFLFSPIYNSVLLAAAFSSHLFLYLYTAVRRLLPDASSVSCSLFHLLPQPAGPDPPPPTHPDCPDKSVLSYEASKSLAAVFVRSADSLVEVR